MTALPIGTRCLLNVSDGVATAGSSLSLGRQPTATTITNAAATSGSLTEIRIGAREMNTEDERSTDGIVTQLWQLQQYVSLAAAGRGQYRLSA